MAGRRGPRGALAPYLFAAPAVFFAAAFSYFPFLRTAAFSVSRVSRRGEILEFVGAANFLAAFGRDDFRASLYNTLRLAAMYVPSSILLAVGLALLVRRRLWAALPEMLFTMPMAVSMSTASLIFKVMLNPTVGIVNSMLGAEFAWFQDPERAMLAVLLLHLWAGLSFDFLIVLASLRQVPGQMLEAARVDGAGRWRLFFSMQLPMLMPALFFIGCINAVLAMMTATPILLITEGGPFMQTQTLVYSMFVFGHMSQNYAAAGVYAMAAFALSLGAVLLAFAALDRRLHYES